MSSNCIWDKKSVQDGILEDEYLDVPTGLRHCRECGKPRQKQFVFNGRVWTPDIPCLCQEKVRQQAEAAVKQRDQMADISRMRISGLQDKNLLQSTFAKDLGFNASAMRKAKQYVEHWEEMKRNNAGMMLLGDTGTGKTFMAGCIANALIEKNVPVLMIPMNRLLIQLSGASFEDKNTFLDSLNRYSLLILDDFGSERDSDYVLEQIYNIIDSRYRSRLPLIVTTNLTLTDMKQPKSKQHKRINERILEMCVPVLVNDQNIREIKAKDKLCNMKQILKKESEVEA